MTDNRHRPGRLSQRSLELAVQMQPLHFFSDAVNMVFMFFFGGAPLGLYWPLLGPYWAPIGPHIRLLLRPYRGRTGNHRVGADFRPNPAPIGPYWPLLVLIRPLLARIRPLLG
jgi:hypothetical protein